MPRPTARSLSLTSQESYSAVIIADLVAEVPISRESGQVALTPKTKEETNLAYDEQLDGETTVPAVLNVVPSETVNFKSEKIGGGSSISKGVILNAMKYGQHDTKFISNSEKSEKPIPLNNSLSVQIPDREPGKTDSFSAGFNQMSFLRKLAFGVSFLPSVLFVLCFAVILPCEKVSLPQPCIKEKWITTLNDTEIIRDLKFAQNLIFIFARGNESGIKGINAESGSEAWSFNTDGEIQYLDCGKVESAQNSDCVLMDSSGILYAFNSSDGNVIWNRYLWNEEIVPGFPVILPDCDNDGVAEIALAVSNTEIKVLFNGYLEFLINVTGCDSVPSRLTAWPRNGTTDLLYVCRIGENETLVNVPESSWCLNNKKEKKESLTLVSWKGNSLSQSVIHPTADDLALWLENEILMIQPDGNQRWITPTLNHSSKNRFMAYGNFIDEETHLAVFSSEIAENFKVTLLNPVNGSIAWSRSHAKTEATDVVKLTGEKRDFVFIVAKQVATDLTTEAVAHINDVSTSIINFITNEEISSNRLNFTNNIMEKLELMNLDQNEVHTIEEAAYGSGVSKKQRVTVISNTKEPTTFTVFVVSKIEDDSGRVLTRIKSIGVDNWDISSKRSKCIWK